MDATSVSKRHRLRAMRGLHQRCRAKGRALRVTDVMELFGVDDDQARVFMREYAQLQLCRHGRPRDRVHASAA